MKMKKVGKKKAILSDVIGNEEEKVRHYLKQ